MKWNQPIVLGNDGMGLDYVETTGSGILKQKWHCETDLSGFYDPNDENDFIQSPEAWASIVSGRNYAMKTRHLKYSIRVGKFLIRPPNPLFPIFRWYERTIYQRSEHPLNKPVFKLNSLRSRKDVIEALWAEFRLKKSDTCFDEADQANVVKLITYNDIYWEGAVIRKLMGEYLNANGDYRKFLVQRDAAIDKIYLEVEKVTGKEPDNDEILRKSVIRDYIDKKGKVKRLIERKKDFRQKLEKRAWELYNSSKRAFLENLDKYRPTDKSVIDFAYFNIIDGLLHVLNERELIDLLYLEACELYGQVNEFAETQNRPLIIVSDHGMKVPKGHPVHDHDTKGFFSANYTFEELQENLNLRPRVEKRFYLDTPKPHDIGKLLRAHLRCK